MGMFIFGYDFTTLMAAMTLTPSTVNATYPVANIINLQHLKKQYRSTVATETTIVVNFGSAKAIVGVFLNDINFTDVYIQGHASDDWGAPSYSQQFTISQDTRVQRYKIYAALSGFNYQYMRIKIPTQSPMDGTVFRIGTFIPLETILTLTKDPSFGYVYEGSDPKPLINQYKSGGYETIRTGDDLIFSCEFSFTMAKASESQLWTLNNIRQDSYLVFFENKADTSKSYLCKKEGTISVEWDDADVIKTNKIILKEII